MPIRVGINGFGRNGRNAARTSPVLDAEPRSDPKVALSPAFKIVILIVTSLTVLSLVVSVLLGLYAQKSDQINALIETCSTTFKLGFGALVGLVGGLVARR